MKKGAVVVVALVSILIFGAILIFIFSDEEINNSSTDKYTLMVYICGSDLESDGGAASNDIEEMLNSQLAKEINLLVYTGGTTSWYNDEISEGRNQIFKIEDGKLNLVNDNIGLQYMSEPNTLAYFLKYSVENYPADKYGLVLWDHGGGPVSGFGFDEYEPDEDESLTIDELKYALETIEQKLDFVGFDACLMSNIETAYAIKNKANYLIASEEIEPNGGWNYKEFLNQLSRDSSQNAEKFGKVIIDSYINDNDWLFGSDATLSLIDLSKMDNVYNNLERFFKNVEQDKIGANDYASIAKAVGKTKSFADGEVDTIDIIDFARNLNIDESSNLINAINECIIYNKTTSDIENSNGLSIYFPNESLENYDKMLYIYKNIGFGSNYINVITEYANILAGGIRNTYSVNNYQYQQSYDDYNNYSWYDSDYINEFSDYYESTQLDSEELELVDKGEYYALALDDEDWEYILDIGSSVWYDDGEGYIDLGIDSYYEQDDAGDLIVSFDGEWISINGHFVRYEVQERTDKYEKGKVPVYLNDKECNLIIYWDEQNTNGIVLGAEPVNAYGNTTLHGKGYTKLKPGDKIEFIFDYYTYDGEYDDSYIVGEPLYVGYDDLVVEYTEIEDGRFLVYYIITDIYNNIYYTESVELY